MDSRSAKRRRTEDEKKVLIPALHELTNVSFQFNEDLDNANEDFILMFKSMGDRQSELYARSIDIDQKYGALLATMKGDVMTHSAESSRQQPELPEAYASDTRKFLDDTSSSLNSHTKRFVGKVDDMIREIDEHAAIWKGKLTEMKKEAEHISSQNKKLGAQLSEFGKNI